MDSLQAQLTQQFYDWEQRGRGWLKSAYPVELEPPFEPFFGHFLEERGIIDDGRRPGLWERLYGAPPKDIEEAKRSSQSPYPYVSDEPVMVFSIAVPKSSRASADQMGQLHVMLSYCNSPMSVELIATHDDTRFQVTCREAYSRYVLTQLRAFFPEYGISIAKEDGVEMMLRRNLYAYTVDFGLADECTRPIAMLHSGSEPYLSLYGILSALEKDEGVIIQALYSGVCNPWGESMLNAVHDNDRKGSFFIDDPDMVRFAHEKVSHPLCAATLRLVTFAEARDPASSLLNHLATAIVHASKSKSNSLVPLSDSGHTAQERLSDILLRESLRTGMLVNVRELSTLAHFPLVPIGNTATHRATKAAPQSVLGHDFVVGTNEHEKTISKVTLSAAERLRHTHILGGSGSGKSTLLHAMMMMDAQLGNGFLCLDPHGDLIDSLMHSMPEHRVRDVVLIDPSDAQHPIPFNILSAHSDQEKELLASDLVALFRRFSTSWGDQMNSVLANAILAFLFNTEVGTLADLRRFLIEPSFRGKILSSVTDPEVSYYWLHEYPIIKGGSIGSILTRLDGFLRPKAIRSMVCQRECLDFASLMDGRKIILVKLSQGLMGAENSYLLGAMLISKVQQIAMARQAQATQARVPFYCYIDEMHQFVTNSIGEILTGGRKYALGLILAHQQVSQLQGHDTDLANAILTNTAVRICFKLGDSDAKRLQEGFASFNAADLQALPVGRAVMRVNAPSEDFNLRVIPFESGGESRAQEIVAHSREAFSRVTHDSAPPEAPPKPRPPIEEPAAANTSQREPSTMEREHTYMQSFVKALAEQLGYTVQLELRTPDGHGQVDVSLERDGRRIAVEISVTTTAEWELHNVRKCLEAGYDQVIVCASSKQKIRNINALAQARLTSQEMAAVAVVPPEHVQSLLAPSPAQSVPAVMKGYRVKVNYEANGSNAGLLKAITAAAQKGG